MREVTCMVISKSRKKNQRVEKTAPEGPGAQETEKFLPHSSFLVIARDLRLDLTICSLIFKNVLVNHIYLYSLIHSDVRGRKYILCAWICYLWAPES